MDDRPMRDPRLAELECLKFFDEQPMTLEVPLHLKQTRFGLETRALREMLAEMIEQGYVNGNATAMADAHVGNETIAIAMSSRINDLQQLRVGRPVCFRTGHKGRARIFELRDVLRIGA